MAEFTSLKNKYLGKSIFSLSIGPSLSQLPLAKLENKFTCGMKLIPLYFMPTFWLCLEEWAKMPAEIWENPTLIKFIPHQIKDKGYLKPQGNTKLFRAEPLNHTPNHFIFSLNEHFNSERYFTEESISWGCEKRITDNLGIQGRRSIFLALFKLYYLLGFRRIYLCGVDFNMTEEKPYCYDAKKNKIAVQENNQLYEALTKRLESLLPQFKEYGLEIYNCNPKSHLTLFPFRDFEQCLAESEFV